MNKLDLDYKNAKIIELYPVEDSMNTMVRCLDARQKDRNLNLFAKVAYEKMDQARSTLDNIEKELDKGPIVAKEKVYQNGKAFVVKQ
jgi:hypothetical protein